MLRSDAITSLSRHVNKQLAATLLSDLEVSSIPDYLAIALFLLEMTSYHSSFTEERFDLIVKLIELGCTALKLSEEHPQSQKAIHEHLRELTVSGLPSVLWLID